MRYPLKPNRIYLVITDPEVPEYVAMLGSEIEVSSLPSDFDPKEPLPAGLEGCVLIETKSGCNIAVWRDLSDPDLAAMQPAVVEAVNQVVPSSS